MKKPSGFFSPQQFTSEEMRKELGARVTPFLQQERNPLAKEVGNRRVERLLAKYQTEIKDLLKKLDMTESEGGLRVRDVCKRLNEIIKGATLEGSKSVGKATTKINTTAERTKRALEGASYPLPVDLTEEVSTINAMGRGEHANEPTPAFLDER